MRRRLRRRYGHSRQKPTFWPGSNVVRPAERPFVVTQTYPRERGEKRRTPPRHIRVMASTEEDAIRIARLSNAHVYGSTWSAREAKD